MNVSLFSDDRYFSSGLMSTLQNEGTRCDIYSISDFNAARVHSMSDFCDLVILDINLEQSLNHLFMMRNTLSNVLFVVDIPPEFVVDNCRVISRRSSTDGLIYKIKRFMNFKVPQVKKTELETLRLYNAGWDISSISSQLNITPKSAYRLRYNLVRKIGFLRYHPVTAIYCEKISALL